MTDIFASLPIFLIVCYVINCVFDFTWGLVWAFFFTLNYYKQYGLDLSSIEKIKSGLILPSYPWQLLVLICVALGLPITYLIIHLQFVP